MPLTDVGAVKAKLGIPADDTGQDAAIAAVLAAAEAWVLDRTRYDLTGGTRIEVLADVPVGLPVALKRRPVTALVAVEGRLLGTGPGPEQWTPLAAGLRDAGAGTLVVLGANEPTAWPPSAGVGVGMAPWFRWRSAVTWPQVRVTYTVAALSPVPADLADLTATLAAYWYDRDRAGAASETDLDPVRMVYHDAAVPPWVSVRLARHVPTPAMAAWV
jgi:hypothetical protein